MKTIKMARLGATAALGAGMMLAALGGAQAQVADTGDVPFTATVTDTCAFETPPTPGRLAVSANGRGLSSANAGGNAGSIGVVTNNGSFELSVADPSGWNTTAGQPVGNNDAGSVFDATATVGTTTIGAGDTPISLPNGTSTATVNLDVSQTAKYTAGAYATVVTVTCSR